MQHIACDILDSLCRGLNVGPHSSEHLSVTTGLPGEFPHFVFKLLMTTQGYNKQRGKDSICRHLLQKQPTIFLLSFYVSCPQTLFIPTVVFFQKFPSLPSVVFCQSVVCGPATSTISWEFDRMPNHKSYFRPTESVYTYRVSPENIHAMRVRI